MQLLSSPGSDSHPIFQGIRTVILLIIICHFLCLLNMDISNSFRLVDELVLLYKESATRKSREIMRNHIVGILVLLQK
jgi:hypothetical protein